MKHEAMLEGRELLPRGTRIEVSWNVAVEFGRAKVAAQVLNVSAQGFRLRTARAIEAGTQVALRFATDAPIMGLIQWASGKEAGGVFVDSVTL